MNTICLPIDRAAVLLNRTFLLLFLPSPSSDSSLSFFRWVLHIKNIVIPFSFFFKNGWKQTCKMEKKKSTLYSNYNMATAICSPWWLEIYWSKILKKKKKHLWKVLGWTDCNDYFNSYVHYNNPKGMSDHLGDAGVKLRLSHLLIIYSYIIIYY